MSAIELLPCPFCGGEAVISRAGGNDERSGYRATWLVTCLMCPSKTSATDIMNKNGWSIAKEGETKARAIAAWNRRTDLSQASVAAALEAAARAGYIACAETRHVTLARAVEEAIRALITPAQHDALAAHVAKARAEDAAKIEAAFSKALRTVMVKHDGQEVGDLPYLTKDSVVDAAVFRAALAQIGAKP